MRGWISWLVMLGLAAAGSARARSEEPLVLAGELFDDVDAWVARISRHSAVHAVAFSPDGRTVASGSEDGAVHLWDRSARREVARLGEHIGEVRAVAFSGDGKILATGSAGGTMRLWDLARHEAEALPDRGRPVHAVAFSLDGRTVAWGSEDGSVQVWRVWRMDAHIRTELHCRVGHDFAVRALAFGDDGQVLATGSADRTVRLWDVTTCRELKRLEGHEGAVLAVAFRGGGQELATGSTDGTVRLWNLWTQETFRETTRERFRTENPSFGAVRSLAFRADGRILAASSDRIVRFLDPETGREIGRLEGHDGPILAIDFGAGGGILASGATDGTVRLWDVAARHEIGRLEGHLTRIRAIAFSSDGKTLAAGSDSGVVRLWDVENGRLRRHLEGHSTAVVAVALLDDGATLVSGMESGTILRWNTATGVGIGLQRGRDPVFSMAFRADGRYAAWSSPAAISGEGETLASDSGGVVRLWDLRNLRKPEYWDEHVGLALAVAFSGDGKTLASGAADGTVGLWDVATGAGFRGLERHEGYVLAMAFSIDGRTLALGSSDGTVGLWNMTTRRELARLGGHDGSVLAVAFSGDGQILASGAEDGTLRLWDVGTGEERARLEGHTGSVRSIAFAPDSDTVASGSADGTLRLWTRGQPSRIFLGGRRGTWLSCQAGGLCLRHDDGTLLVEKDHGGGLRPAAPEEGSQAPTELEIVEPRSPIRIETQDGEVASFDVVVRNRGEHRAFWLNARPVEPTEEGIPIFYPPPSHAFLDPGDEVRFTFGFSMPSAYEDPQGRVTELRLEVASWNSEPVLVPPVEAEARTPALTWNGSWSQNGNQLILSLANDGAQDLTKSELQVSLPGHEALISPFDEPIRANTEVSIPFTLPDGVEIEGGTSISLEVRKLDVPAHVWTFQQTLVRPRWPFYLMTVLLLCGLAWVSLLLDPNVLRVSRHPETLVGLPLAQLPRLRRLLWITRRLDAVLANAKVHGSWLDTAIAFNADPDPETRCHHLADRLGVRPEAPFADNPALRILPLGPSFPLNLDRCLLYLPSADLPAADIRNLLNQRPETQDLVTLILSADAGCQEDLHDSASDLANLWVALSGAQLTGLLLAAEPVIELARLVASQVPRVRISPYQIGGGVAKASIFFGREQILAHVLNREPANYLVAGGRQIGKSSLLKAIDRHFRERSQVRCYYVVLHGSEELGGDLAHAVGLPRETGIDDVLAHLVADVSRRHLVLIDEADPFIRAERRRDYPILAHLRSLSESGRCHFILAGFWDLYKAAVLDYHSPLSNFGETVTIGALEADACRNLATAPMATMNVSYESEALVALLVNETGQRANLISITCSEILKNLDPKDRTIRAADVVRAFESDAIERALSGWQELAGDDNPAGKQLDRLLVYATIRRASFTLNDVLRLFQESGNSVSIDRVERSLERLRLAFVLDKQEAAYRYKVPLFRKMICEQDPEVLLEHELRFSMDDGSEEKTPT